MTASEKSLSQRIAARAAAAIAWVRGVSLFIKVVLVAGGALLSGAAKYLPLATTPFDYQGLVATIGLVAAFIGGVALIFLDKSLAGSLQDAADAAADLQGVRADAALLSRQFDLAASRDARSRALRAAATTLLEVVGPALSRGPGDEGAIISALLDLGLSGLVQAMGFSPGEMWTVSVYRAEGTPPVLRRLATRRSNRPEELLPSREWPSGEGHIGMAFIRKQELVLVDVNDPTVRPLLHTPPEKHKIDDPERYRSVAAVPVLVDGATLPWGVVIATSSEAGRFDPAEQSEGSERAETMRLLGSTIALVVTTQHILADRKAQT